MASISRPEFLAAASVRFGKIANNTAELDSYADNENFLNEDTYPLIITTSRTDGRVWISATSR